MRFTFFTAVSAALLLADTQTVLVKEQLYAQIEGEGHSSADLKATAMTGAEIEAEIQAEADADAELCARAAETDIIKTISDVTSQAWPQPVQIGWKQIVKGVRGTNQSSMTRWIQKKLQGQTLWQSLQQDYTDHCAVSQYPLSLKEWFDQVNFYQGHGDWFTWEKIESDLGNKPSQDSYIVARRDARNEARREELERLAKKLNAVIAEATTVGKPASQYKVNKDGKMSQAFLDAVAKNKDNKNKVSIKSKTQKSPDANDVVDSLVGKDLTDAKEEKDPVDGEKGDAKVEKKG